MFDPMKRNGFRKRVIIGALLIGAVVMTACNKKDKDTEYEIEAAKQAKYETMTYQNAMLAEEVRAEGTKEAANEVTEGVAQEEKAVTGPKNGYDYAIVINNQKSVLTIDCGTDSMMIDPEGLHINSNGGKVDISSKGIYVKDEMSITEIGRNGVKVEDDKSSVNISPDRIHIKDWRGTEVDIDLPNVMIKGVNIDEGNTRDAFLSELLPEIIADAQGDVDFLDFSKMNTQLMEQNITVDGVTKKIKIYVKDGFFITMNCSEEYSTIHGLTLEKTETDQQGNVFRYYSNDFKE